MVAFSIGSVQSIAAMLAKKFPVPHISGVYRFEKVKKAHQLIESGKTKRKIILFP